MTYYALAQLIDQQEREVTTWESRFLEDMLRRGMQGTYSISEQAKLRELGETYLPTEVMLHFNGQLRLFSMEDRIWGHSE